VIDLSKPTRDLVDEVIQIAKEHRKKWVGDWSANLRRLAGFTEEDIRLRSTSTGSVTSGQPVIRKYVTSFNTTRSYYQRLVGRCMPVIVNFQVMAASMNEDDRDTAYSASKLLRSRTSPDSGKDFEAVVRCMSYLFCGGPSLMMIEGVVPPDDPAGGDVVTEAVMPGMFYYLPGGFDINDSPVLIVDRPRTESMVRERHPELADRLSWDKMDGAKWPDDMSLDSITDEMKSCCAMQRDLWIRPCRQFPEGIHRVFMVGAEDVLAEYPSLESPDGKYPGEVFSDVPMGPFMEDRGRLTISSHMQRSQDILISKAITVTVDSPQAFVGLPHGMTRDDVTNEPINYYAKLGQDAAAVTLMPGIERLQQMLGIVQGYQDQVHGQGPSSRGIIPGTRTSGRAMEQATMADMAADEPFVAMVRRTMGRVGKRILMTGKEVWSDEYRFQVLGKHNLFESMSFKKANLKDGYDVRVMPDQGLPTNKAARMQLVEKGLQAGLFADTPEAARARELLGIHSDDEDIYETDQAEEQVIRREEEAISSGMAPPIHWSDNHPMHMARHRQGDVERNSGKPIGVPAAAMGPGGPV
jgi:hypothetical protein